MNRRKVFLAAVVLIGLVGMLFLVNGGLTQAATPGQGSARSPDALASAQQAWQIQTVEMGHMFNRWTNRAIAVDASGKVHIAYGGGHLYYYDGTSIQVVDDSPFVGEYASLALDSAGHPHIAYEGLSTLKYAYYDGTRWHVETVDRDGNVGRYASLALDGAGRPHIAYYDDTHLTLKYAYYDGAQWHTETVDSDG